MAPFETLIHPNYINNRANWKPISRVAVDVRVDGEEETHTEHVRDLT
jgi:hypothetical protein